MKPVMQTRLGVPNGNCFAACVASLLECPIEEVDYPMLDGPEWLPEWNERLKHKGWMYLEQAFDAPLCNLPDKALVIMTGPNANGCLHSIIAEHFSENGRHAFRYQHDPNPSGRFITAPHWIGFLCKYCTLQEKETTCTPS